MEKGRFSIVFEKLSEAVGEEGVSWQFPFEAEAIRTELEEIAELRKLALEITEPEPMSYTTT